MTAQQRIHEKPVVFRSARARGDLRLTPESRRAIRGGRVKKGDPIATAELAGLQAMKRTHELLPHCHLIPLTGAEVVVQATPRGVRAEAVAEALHRTGVEMEALVGVSVALLTVWDMVKYLEKNEGGQYPTTRIGPIRVVRKTKSGPMESR